MLHLPTAMWQCIWQPGVQLFSALGGLSFRTSLQDASAAAPQVSALLRVSTTAVEALAEDSDVVRRPCSCLHGSAFTVQHSVVGCPRSRESFGRLARKCGESYPAPASSIALVAETLQQRRDPETLKEKARPFTCARRFVFARDAGTCALQVPEAFRRRS